MCEGKMHVLVVHSCSHPIKLYLI